MEQASGAALPIQSDSINESVVDYPVTLPVQVLRKLVDISDTSKGLFSLWNISMYLTKEKLMKDEVRIKHVHSYVYACS